MRDVELYRELQNQAFRETLPKLGNGVYSILPNDLGKAMVRFTELCAEHGICPGCAMPVEECDCKEAENEQ